MKLIFITRKVDRTDPLTGFIFGWINAVAKNLEQVYVVCQEKGDTSGLPDNVEVHSFGKDRGYGRIRQAFSLWLLAFRFAKKADGIFVHMHPVYVMMIAVAAKLFRRRLVFWYAHGHVDFKLKLATFLSDRIVSSSPEGFRYQTGRVRFIGQAIDTEFFSPQSRTAGPVFKILSLGRISPVKRLDLFIEALERLKQDHPSFVFAAAIVGKPGLPEHEALLKSLKLQAQDAGLEEAVIFLGPVPHRETVKLFRDYDLLINVSETGSLDKAVLEAMAAGSLVLTGNEAYRKFLPSEAFLAEPSAETVAARIWELAHTDEQTSQARRQTLRNIVIEHHSLSEFTRKLLAELQ